MQKIEIYVVDNHTMFITGFVEMVNRNATIHISHTFNTIELCKQALFQHQPTVILLNISMSNSSDFCQWLLTKYPTIKILAISSHNEYSAIRRMLNSGAHGYILQSQPIEELISAIETIVQNKIYMSAEVHKITEQNKDNEIIISDVEKNIIRNICNGRTNPEIANTLNLSTETINWYRKRLLAKLGVNNTATLVATVIKNCLLE